ncbi:MAG TPA: pyruvate kinase [Clostridia bacterium]|nr:pyruvate kinase [Clostridia bacterium]
MRRTKIVCTLGPATEDKAVLKEMIQSGMDVARLNFSHGSHSQHRDMINKVKEIRKELGRPVALLLDTKGPEIRIKTFAGGRVFLREGNTFVLTTREVEGGENIVSVTYKDLPRDLEKGYRVLIDDGLIELRVEEIKGEDVICRVENGGELKDNKGVNLPGALVGLPAVSEKDREDILFGIENDVDFIAASFTRKPEDILEVRRILEENGGGHIRIIAKIENQQGVDNLDGILEVADGIMVARGDLGVEIPTEGVPILQKEIIKKCNLMGKPVITATQMLDSMIRNPRPTRAEVADVANAVLDGTDAIMLSGETAAGKYPVEAIRTMARIAERAEESYKFGMLVGDAAGEKNATVTNAVSYATCAMAHNLNAAAIITATQMGYTARMVSKHRPQSMIIGSTPNERVLRQLNLSWGVYPVLAKPSDNTDDTLDTSVKAAMAAGYIREGDLVVITAGVPTAVTGTTNLIRVHTVAKVLTRGKGVGNRSAFGKVVFITDPEAQREKFQPGNVLVIKAGEKEMVPYMEMASAIIAEEGGLTSHAAIVGFNLGKPTVVGAARVFELLEDGEIVTVDGTTGLIYRGIATVM